MAVSRIERGRGREVQGEKKRWIEGGRGGEGGERPLSNRRRIYAVTPEVKGVKGRGEGEERKVLGRR